jgi:hypothetical protein
MHIHRPVLFLLVGLGTALGLLFSASAARAVDDLPPDDPTFALPSLEEINKGRMGTWVESIHETGLTRDAIPSVDFPQFISLENASLAVDAKDVVFVADFSTPDKQDVRIYPRGILVWHQVINDTGPNGERIAVTYCPLTGTLVGYYGKVGRYTPRFGVTGNLINNNTLLYDRSTGSLWPQILGMAIEGALKGQTLETFPLLWTTWERAVERFPQARALSQDTGFRRTYGRDPYGNYTVNDSYYHDSMIVYPLVNWDKRLHPKTRVKAFTLAGMGYAVLLEHVRQQGAVNFEAGMIPLVALHDPGLDVVRLFHRSVRGASLTLDKVADEFRDRESKTVWTPEGLGVSGPYFGERLEPFPSFDSMWFAWAAFYPDVEVTPPLPKNPPPGTSQ